MKLDVFTPADHAQVYEIATEEDLALCFREKDRQKVILPRNMEFPLKVRYFLSWTESSGSYTYLVFKGPNWDTPRGLVFRKTASDMGTSGMCDWCHAYGGSDQVGLLTVKINSKTTIGQYLCLDINCLDHLETQMSVSGKNFETLALQVCTKIARFYEKHFMSLGNV